MRTKTKATAPRARAEEMGSDPQPFEVGQEVTIVQAPTPELVGQTGSIVSAHCGQYYAVDVGGVVSYLPDASLGGERPAMAGATVEEDPPPAAPVVPPPAEAPAAQARALAALGGGTVAGQLQAAALHALGRDVMARTRAASPDAAMMAVEGALLAAEQIPGLRAELATLRAADVERTKADDLRKRGDRLNLSVTRNGLTPAKARDEHGQIRAVWMRGTLDDLDATLSALEVDATPIARPPVVPDPVAIAGGAEIPEAVRAYAAKRGRGNDLDYMRRLAANLPNSGSAPQES